MSPGAFTYAHWRFQVDVSVQRVLGCRLRSPRSRWDVNRRLPPLVLVFFVTELNTPNPGGRTRAPVCGVHFSGASSIAGAGAHACIPLPWLQWKSMLLVEIFKGTPYSSRARSMCSGAWRLL